MTVRTFASLIPKITPFAPGCPEPVLIQQIRDAAIEVCENTLAWRYEQDAFPLTQGVYTYEYEVPDNTEVVAIFQTALNDNVIPTVTLETLLSHYPSWPSLSTDKRSQPQLVSQFDPDHFVVAPVPDLPDTPYSLKMFLALRPTPDATGMEEVFFDELEHVITHSSLVRILSMPEKSWTDTDLADYHARQVVFKTASRRSRANLGNGRASLTVRAVPFGA